MVECAYSGCDNQFEPNRRKGQKYCSSACSVKANNDRAVANYHRRKKLMEDPKRKCATVGCPTILRRTNTGDHCDPCTATIKTNREKNFRDMVLGQ